MMNKINIQLILVPDMSFAVIHLKFTFCSKMSLSESPQFMQSLDTSAAVVGKDESRFSFHSLSYNSDFI